MKTIPVVAGPSAKTIGATPLVSASLVPPAAEVTGKIAARAQERTEERAQERPPASAPAAIARAIAPPAAHSLSAPAPDTIAPAAYAPLPATQDRPAATQDKPAATQEKPAATQPPEANLLALPAAASAMRDAIAAYKTGDMEKGDAAARPAHGDADARLALEWSALKLQPRAAGFARIAAFLDANPQWPMGDWLRARAEQTMYIDKPPAARIARWFEIHKPASPTGHMLVARQLVAGGKSADAAALLSRLWREDDLGAWAEAAILKEFAALLTANDHRWRSDRFFYREKYQPSLAAAAHAGKDYLAFANARSAVARGADPAKAGEKLDAKWRNDPTWHFARITRLRKAQKYEEAAKLLVEAPADPALIVEAGEWWEERRIVARKRLDSGDAEAAYAIVAKHGATSGEPFISAEFHAGWIALQFRKQPEVALEHFARAASVAATPMSRSRIAYWQARAAEASAHPADADRLYAIAAQYSSSYYGQLAMERLGRTDLPIRTAAKIAEGDQRLSAIRVVEMLEALGEKELSLSLAVGMGRGLDDPSQLAALAGVLAKSRHARATLVVGKLASQRGIELDDIAFPTYGVPDFAPLANSAERSLVYAIARQESAFQANVVSHAGAKGLMQMLTSTAQRTAKAKNVAFDANRLLSDPSFNAQLGAAHLGELMEEHPGSLLMVFAAYNAGGHRVKQWIAAYGDPRKPGVDPIDWVERIPFTETRNYVQRVAENLAIYRKLLNATAAPRVAEKELRAFAARM